MGILIAALGLILAGILFSQSTFWDEEEKTP
jgi:hypothetical protein